MGSLGDDGNNWLVGSLGEDQFNGGAGHDYLVADAADIANTQDNIQGGAGFDVVQFVGDTGVAFNLQQSQVEMAIGTDGADILASGSSDQSIINGGGGHDVILGGSADSAHRPSPPRTPYGPVFAVYVGANWRAALALIYGVDPSPLVPRWSGPVDRGRSCLGPPQAQNLDPEPAPC